MSQKKHKNDRHKQQVVKQGPGLLAQNRACLGCAGCCYSHAVSEINKPAEKWCEHAVPGVGCMIYETRPQSCRDFACLWASTRGLVPHEDRPDKCGVVYSVTKDGNDFGRQVVVARESEPGGFSKMLAILSMARMAERGLLLKVKGDSRQFDGPPDQVKVARDFIRSRLNQGGTNG